MDISVPDRVFKEHDRAMTADVEILDYDKTITALEAFISQGLVQSILRSDKEAEDVADEILNRLETRDMVYMLRAFFRADQAALFALFGHHIDPAIRRTAEYRAIEQINDYMRQKQEEHEERKARMY